MGIEIEVDSLEDLCALMCDNVIPKKGKSMNKYLFVGSERQREIVLILQKEHYARAKELAERLGVTERTIRSDIKALSKILPIHTIQGRHQGGIYMDHGEFVE